MGARPPGLLAVLVVLAALGGCTLPGAHPGPPCTDSSPVRVLIAMDKTRFTPGEWMNVTLHLENEGSALVPLEYRSWELAIRTADGRVVRAHYRDFEPEPSSGNRTLPGHSRTQLQEKWPAFAVLGEGPQPLPEGIYYLCVAVTAPDGRVAATGSRAFEALAPGASAPPP